MNKTRRTLLASLLVAVTVALGFVLAGVPNVELMTITVFLSGYLLGARSGALIGIAVAMVYSVFSPMGAGLPPLIAGQALAFGLIGLVGGALGPGLAGLRPRWLAMAAAGVTGFVLTFLFQVLVNSGGFFSFSADKGLSALVAFVAAGIAFTVVHLAWNTALFSIVLIPVMGVLSRYRAELDR